MEPDNVLVPTSLDLGATTLLVMLKTLLMMEDLGYGVEALVDDGEALDGLEKH